MARSTWNTFTPGSLLGTAALGLALLLAGCQPGAPPQEVQPTAPVGEPATDAPPPASPTAPPTTALQASLTPGMATSTPFPPEPTATLLPPSPTPLPAAQDFPDPTAYTWTPVVGGLQQPLGLAHAGDGSGRLFVIEQGGLIRVVQDGALLPAPFLDLRGRAVFNASEQGLLGIAFHPRYAENGFFYVNYTDAAGDTVVARYQVSGDPDIADPASEFRLLQVRQPFRNHNGGGLAFGPDGYLYIGLGDGGSAGDPQGNGQSLDTLLGKILRLDVDGGEPYAIPASNPFAAGGGRPEIWAYGLRNPWRLAFDSLTGDLFLGDVGQNAWEEINVLAGATGGVNFGWDFREGFHPFEGRPPDGLSLVEPVAEYDHSQGCSVTGGEMYRGQGLPAWQGVYLYGDYCSGRVWGLLQSADGAWTDRLLFNTGARIASFGRDEAGEVYLVDYNGRLLRLAPN